MKYPLTRVAANPLWKKLCDFVSCPPTKIRQPVTYWTTARFNIGPFDPSIDADKISAKIDQGIMTLTLPKAEQVKPRKIKVS
jgi:hypothetical protein